MKHYKCSERAYRMLVNRDCYNVRRFTKRKITTILDIGANVGIFSTLCRFLFPEARIIALEPHKETFDVLQYNCAGLGIDTRQLAAADGNFVTMSDYDWSEANHIITTHKEQLSNMIPSLSPFGILDLIKDEKLSEVFLKMDCEGGEYWWVTSRKICGIMRQFGGIGFEGHTWRRTGLTNAMLLYWVEKFKRRASTGTKIDYSPRHRTFHMNYWGPQT